MRIEAHPTTIKDLEWHAQHMEHCQNRINHYANKGDYESVVIWQEMLGYAEANCEQYLDIMRDYIRVVK